MQNDPDFHHKMFLSIDFLYHLDFSCSVNILADGCSGGSGGGGGGVRREEIECVSTSEPVFALQWEKL